MKRLFSLLLALALLCAGCGKADPSPAPPAASSAPVVLLPETPLQQEDEGGETYTLDREFSLRDRTLTVRLHGRVDRSGGVERCGVHTVEVLEGDTVIQTISVADAIAAACAENELTLTGTATDFHTADSGLALEDLNFDGLPDLRLIWFAGNVNFSWLCWLWDTEADQFRYGFDLSGYELSVDGKKGHLVTASRESAGRYRTDRYGYDSAGELLHIQSVLEDFGAPGATENAPVVTVHELVGGKWVQTTPPVEDGQPEFAFSQISHLEFYFSSGAGAWRTVLHVHDDGTFDGVFLDSDMGDSAAAYPNGTVYYSEFTGSFGQPRQVNDLTWAFPLRELHYAHKPDTEEIRDGSRYLYSDAYGLAGAEELLLYLPGSPLTDLPEEYLTWVGYYNLELTEETELPYHGLYNPADSTGFSSYAMAEEPPAAPETLVDVFACVPGVYADLKYATADNFTGKVIYDSGDVLLRKGTADKLVKAQELLLSEGYSLLVWDAYRPTEAQFRLWEACPDPNYVSDPNQGFSSHSRGNTVDVTLVTADGLPVVMPSGFDEFSPLGDRNYADVSAAARQNAERLEAAMTAAGFRGYAGEWWHYTDETDYPVIRTGDPKAELLAVFAAVEADAAALELRLQSPTATQADLNQISGELFRLWDELLNREWAVLKGLLPAETMARLTAEQLEWIAAKEAAVEKAGAEVAGGSMYPLVVNQTAANLTRERVYALTAYL